MVPCRLWRRGGCQFYARIPFIPTCLAWSKAMRTVKSTSISPFSPEPFKQLTSSHIGWNTAARCARGKHFPGANAPRIRMDSWLTSNSIAWIATWPYSRICFAKILWPVVIAHEKYPWTSNAEAFRPREKRGFFLSCESHDIPSLRVVFLLQ